MSKARRARIFAQHGGVCGISGRKIGPNDAWNVEHRIPWAISFDDSDENLYPALVEPHADKTKTDRKDIAKVYRLIKKCDPETRKPPKMRSANRWPPRGSQKINSRPFDKRGKHE